MSTTVADLNWHRTSPVAVVFYLFGAIRQLLTNGLPGIIVLAAMYSSWSSPVRTMVWSGLALFLVLGIVVSILSWLRFRFCITGDRVLVKKGVLHREELSVEFGRIQNIRIREPFYMRPFGLAVVGIDTAGSNKKEIDLGGIEQVLAVRLRETILSNAREERIEDDAEAQAYSDPSVLLTRSVRDIVLYGLTANFILWVLIAVGAIFGAFDSSDKTWGWLASRFHIEDFITAVQTGGNLPVTLLVLTGLILAVILLLPLVSVVGALIRHYGYRLSVNGETYRRAGGLLTRHEESLKRHKIQAIVLKQNIVARFFKRTNMQLRLASAGSGVESGQLPIGPKATFVIPALHDHERAELGAEFFPGCDIDSARLSRTNRRRLMTLVLAIAAIPTLAITTTLGFLLSWKFIALPPIVFGIVWIAVTRYWTKAGYAVAGDFGFVRHGFLGTSTTVFPLFKVQRIDIQQTPGQRRKGLAHLTIHLASHSLNVHYIDVQDAEQIRDLALFYAESSNQAWY